MPSEAHAPLSRLRSAGINAVVRDEATLQLNWLWSNAIGGVKIDVPDEDYEDSLELLNLKPSERGLMICPFCKSTDLFLQPINLLSAIAMFFHVLIPMKTVKMRCRSCGKAHRVDRVDGHKT